MEKNTRKGLLPTRPKLNGAKKRYAKTGLVSNHYSFRIENLKNNEKLYFRSWSLTLEVETKDKNQNEDEILEIEKDSRRLYEKILVQFRSQIRNKIGYFIASGQLLYSIERKDTEKYIVFNNETGPNVILQLNPDRIDLNSLFLGFKMNSEITKLCNLILKAKFKEMGMVELGRLKKYYEPGPKRIVCGRTSFLIMKGFSSSILPYEGGLLLNLNFSTRIMRDSSLWKELKQELNGNYNRKDFNSFIETNVIGRSFILKHANHRIVRIDSINEKMKITDAFPNKNFKNYADYFFQRYKIKLNDKSQLMCCEFTKNYKFDRNKLDDHSEICRDRRGEFIYQENWYPSELLTPCGLTDKMRNDFKIMKEIATVTKKSPIDRMMLNSKKIAQANASTSSKSLSKDKRLDFAKELNLIIDEKSNNQEALLFTPPTLTFGGKKNKISLDLERSNFNMKKPIYDEKRKLGSWALVYDYSKADYVEECVNNLLKASTSFKINIKEPNPIFEIDGRNLDPEDLLKKILERNEKVKMVFFFVSDRNYFYNPVKYYFSEKKILTQFFTNFRERKRPNLSVYSKLVLQMMAKLGKVLWKVQRGLYTDKGKTSIIMGIDLVRFKGGHLISATMSMDRQFSKFYNQCGFVKASTKQNTKDLHSTCISSLVKKCVGHFVKKNKIIPQNIIVYRSGYGNARHLQDEIGYEATLIKNQLEKISSNPEECRLLYLCVNKRMEDRFFVKNGGNKVHNPNGGLIIINRVTQKDRFDFFMVAQKVTQGCATPTHYFSILNDTELT